MAVPGQLPERNSRALRRSVPESASLADTSPGPRHHSRQGWVTLHRHKSQDESLSLVLYGSVWSFLLHYSVQSTASAT